jgi:hypothetical protein
LVSVASLDLPRRVRTLLSGLEVKLSPQSVDLISNALEFDPIRRQKSAVKFANAIADDMESIQEV